MLVGGQADLGGVGLDPYMLYAPTPGDSEEFIPVPDQTNTVIYP